MSFLLALLSISVAIVHGQNTACEQGTYQNQYGICVIDPSSCQGYLVDGLCGGNGDQCCYGTYNPSSSQPNGQCPYIIRRSEWGAAAPIRTVNSLPSNVGHVFIHHTDDGGSCFDQQTCSLRVRSLQSYHQKTKNWADIAWNFLIGGDGQVYEGVGWTKEGFHTLNWNSQSIGIAFIGNFDSSSVPTAMTTAAQNLISCGVNGGYLSYNYLLHGHSDARQTSCPGYNLYNIIRNWNNFQAGPLPGYN